MITEYWFVKLNEDDTRTISDVKQRLQILMV